MEGVHISPVICVRGNTYHGGTHITATPVLSELNPPKMGCSSSAGNDSVILTKDDIPGASSAGLNPSSLKNEELRFRLRDAM